MKPFVLLSRFAMVAVSSFGQTNISPTHYIHVGAGRGTNAVELLCVPVRIGEPITVTNDPSIELSAIIEQKGTGLAARIAWVTPSTYSGSQSFAASQGKVTLENPEFPWDVGIRSTHETREPWFIVSTSPDIRPGLDRLKELANDDAEVCLAHLKQISYAYANWAVRHKGAYPFNVSTNARGSKELCSKGDDGFEKNPATQFRHLANDLEGYAYENFTLKILVCPADTNRQPALDFRKLGPSNVSYQLRCCTANLKASESELMLYCPVHGWSISNDGYIVRREVNR